MELNDLLEKLKLTDNTASVNSAIDEMVSELDREGVDRTAYSRQLQEAGVIAQLTELVKSHSTAAKAAELTAELAKSEDLRVCCVEAGLLPLLIHLLDNKDFESCVQACRALGNICFDNNEARSAVDELGGVQRLLDLLKSQLSNDADEAERLRAVSCGFLLNLTNTHGMKLTGCNVQSPFSMQKLESDCDADATENFRMISVRVNMDNKVNQESIQEKALMLGAMEILDKYLHRCVGEESTCHMALLCVGSLADSDYGKVKLSECEVAITVARLLATPGGMELHDIILELLANLAESDEVKLQLAQSGVMTDRLLPLLHSCARAAESSDQEDSQQTEKLASDLLVLLLTGDRSMEALYDGGAGQVYKQSLNWLISPREHLRVCGALAIGNFARNDEHCLQLVADGVTDRLLSVLRHGGEDIMPTLLHATLSALRNLAIPSANKPVLLQCGLIDHLLPYITHQMTVVQYKLLATLRMVIDKQQAAATRLGTNEQFVTKLLELCKVEDHAGVKGEATRLVAWLVKNSRHQPVMKCLAVQGALPHLVNMTNSEFPVMQNEALLALTLITTFILEDVEEELLACDVVPSLKLMLSEADTQPEILCNVLALTTALSASQELRQLLLVAEMDAMALKLEHTGDRKIQVQAKAALTALQGNG